jgi:penicillin-binding protein 1A
MAHRLGVQSPIQPNASFAVGSEEISSLDFADSAATVADLGVRHESYYIERIEDPNGNVIYQHQDPGTQVLDQGVALRMIDVLKGVVTKGTVALDNSKPLADGRISAGKTGTYTDNTNATFVGFTTQLAAAVWMGNPLKSGEDQMRNIPEFNQIGVSRVQGGNLPYRIWKAFMDGASQGMPNEDWPAPPPPKRKAQNVYLPGYECLARVGSVSGDPSGTNPDGSPSFDQSTYNQVKSGTTIPPTNLDPTAPVGAYAPGGVSIYKCGTAPVNTAPRPAKTTTPTTAAGAAPPSASTPAAPTKPSSPPASAAVAATPPNAEKP